MKKILFLFVVFQFLGCTRYADYQFIVVNKSDKPIMIDHSHRGDRVYILQPNKMMKVSLESGNRGYAEDIYKDRINHFEYFKVYIIEEPILFNENSTLIEKDFLDRELWDYTEISEWLGQYSLVIR